MEATTTTSPDSVSDRKPSQEIITQVAALEGVEPTALTPPLYSAIDPEALDSLISSSTADESQPSPRVQFTYQGYDIGVAGDGDVTLTEI